MRVRPGGPVTTGIAERQAVQHDILSVAITCLIVVALSIGVYFRRFRSIFLVGIPAVIGALNKNRPAIMMANGYQDSIFGPQQLVDFFAGLTTPKRLQLAPGLAIDHKTAVLLGV